MQENKETKFNNQVNITVMLGVFNHYDLQVGDRKQIGVASLSAFEIKVKDNPIAAMRAAMDGMRYYDGKYIRLAVNGELMMTDTDMEKNSNMGFVNAANGEVLVAGLGIGLIIYNALNNPCVKHITIIEKYQDVIDLVSPYFKNTRVTFICADIMEWRPEKGKKFDTIYFDIWPTICGDNLKQIKFLHNVFKSRLNRTNPDCWMNSWMKERLQRENRKSNSYW